MKELIRQAAPKPNRPAAKNQSNHHAQPPLHLHLDEAGLMALHRAIDSLSDEVDVALALIRSLLNQIELCSAPGYAGDALGEDDFCRYLQLASRLQLAEKRDALAGLWHHARRGCPGAILPLQTTPAV